MRQTTATKLPLYYRLVLKLPCPNLDFLPGISKGIFWAIVVPIFMVLELFLSLYLLLGFSFPLNLFLVGVIPFIFFIAFLRVSLERLVVFLDTATAESRFVWNVNRSAEEYIRLIEKTKSKKKE